MKLYVDDIRSAPNTTWQLCRSNLEAIKALDLYGTSVEAISLDHDISHPPEGRAGDPCSCAETFEVTTRYIALLKRLEPTWRPCVTIHTSNPDGANAMEAVLTSVGLRPKLDLQPAAHR